MASFNVLDSAAEQLFQPSFDQNRHCRELWGLNDQKAIMKQSAEREEILIGAYGIRGSFRLGKIVLDPG